MDQPGCCSDATTRRGFLGRLALLAVPALARCGGGESDASAQRPLADSEGPLRRRPALPAREPQMRVRVLKARGAEAGTSLGREQQWLRVGPAGHQGAEVVLRGPLEVRAGARRWSIVDANGVKAAAEDLEPLEVAALAAKQPVVTVSERAYPGSIQLVARNDLDDGAFDVINVVGMEAYLPGVVAGELFDHWRLHTRAAQAVAARSFAASERAQFRGRRAYDVTNTPNSQVYRGIVDHQETLEAVEMTRGVVLAYEGLLVSGYYSSCCGGLAATAVDAIGHNPINDTPPLEGRRGVDVCTEVKIARWTIERPVQTLTQRLAAWGDSRRRSQLAELGEIAAVEIAERNSHGRPTRYAVTDKSGRRVELSDHHLRTAANYTGPGLSAPQRSLWSSYVSVTVRDSTAVFDGRGYGHGVGMCQYGAETLARSGKSYEEILAWYYPGAEFTRAYS
ncbi:MAG: SpoIID/LytB domain-containing protein [Planctomycetota bacterium]